MRWKIALAVLFLATPVLAQPTAPTAFCPYGQTCQSGAPSVPFPVINPVQGLNNVLTLPLQNNQPPPPQPGTGYAPIATPPPVLPPQR
jgi:hypothetical protein